MVDLALSIYPQLLNTIQQVIHRFSTIDWVYPHNDPHPCRAVCLMPLAGSLQRPENGDGGWWLKAEGEKGCFSSLQDVMRTGHKYSFIAIMSL